jgi:hypothetical protein
MQVKAVEKPNLAGTVAHQRRSNEKKDIGGRKSYG